MVLVVVVRATCFTAREGGRGLAPPGRVGSCRDALQQMCSCGAAQRCVGLPNELAPELASVLSAARPPRPVPTTSGPSPKPLPTHLHLLHQAAEVRHLPHRPIRTLALALPSAAAPPYPLPPSPPTASILMTQHGTCCRPYCTAFKAPSARFPLPPVPPRSRKLPPTPPSAGPSPGIPQDPLPLLRCCGLAVVGPVGLLRRRGLCPSQGRALARGDSATDARDASA